MNRHSITTIVAGVTLLGAALAITAGSDTEPESERSRPAARRVEVAPVEVHSTTRTLRLPGVTRAADRAQLSFSIPARVATRPVDVGDRIRAGAVVATLDDREFRIAEQAAAAALAELEVRLAQARREQQRTEQLADAEAATTEELEQTRAAAAALAAAREAAAARLAETRRLLTESTLRSPFDGIVSAVHVEPGEWAAPGGPVVELSGTGDLEIVVEAPESAWSRLAAGRPVSVELPFLGIQTDGRISRLSSVSGGPGGLFPVEIALAEHQAVVAGLAAEVILPLESEPRATVPLRAVLNPGSSRPAVFRITDGRAERVEVKIGEVVGEWVAVEGALSAGDLVATAGHTALADRDPVEVL